MSLDFSKGLFDSFGADNALQSVTTERSTATSSQASQLRIRLEKYLPVEPAEGQPQVVDPSLPDEAKVRNCMTALDNYGQGANVLNSHVQSRLETFLEDMQVASAIKEIDSYITNTGPSCSNINTIAGTLAGATDALLDATSDALDELDQGITDFDNGVMEKEPFEELLDRVADELNNSAAGILGMVSNEAAMLENMYQQHKQMASAYAAQALMNDPCVRPFIVQLAGPQLSQVLVDDFGIEDVEEVLD